MNPSLTLRKSVVMLAAGVFAAAVAMAEPPFPGSESSSYKIVRTGRKEGQENVFYMVRRGDTLAKIAKKMLGDGSRWREIAAVNPHVKPENMQVGSRLLIPAESDALVAADLPELIESRKEEATYKPVSGRLTTTQAMDFSFIDTLLPCDEELKKVAASDQNRDNVSSDGNTLINSHFSGAEFELPENLKPEKISPNFANARGFHGIFNTESAFYPPVRTLNAGLNIRYDNYSESPYGNFKLSGSQWQMPFNLLFLRNRLMAGLTLPVQSWEVQRTDGDRPSVSMSSLHDPAIRFGYQIWHDFASEQAISLHFAARFPSGNYHQPKLDMTDKTRNAVQVGPAEATRGGWVQLGGAYSRRLNERWNSHFNLTLASNPRDRMTRITPTCALDYRLSDSWIFQAEADASSWTLENGPDGTNLDILFGVAWFTSRWQFSLGIPIAASSDWGYERDIGVQLGLNYRQD